MLWKIGFRYILKEIEAVTERGAVHFMSETITVWTKQHEDVIKELEETGRHIAKREYIFNDLGEHAPLVLEVYDWLAKNSPGAAQKPTDVKYPVWVSAAREATMLPDKGTVILELNTDPALITPVNIDKWGAILNSYIPADEKDAERHRKLLEEYGVSDAKAYMSQFYPVIKREIVASWSRLFDASIVLGSENSYGNIWEVKREWVTQIIQ